MTNYTERILNKIAYADGEKTVDGTGLTVVDHGKRYKFELEGVADAVEAPKDMGLVQGVAYRLLGFGTEDRKLPGRPRRPERSKSSYFKDLSN